jgi:uncharacterized membrane protein
VHVSPFDWRSVLLARHAQHVVLIHFPIALFITGVLFDVSGARFRQLQLKAAAYWNFCVAAVFTIPVLATGLIAWQWALEGQRLKGTLLLHLLSALAATAVIWIVWWLERRARQGRESRGAEVCKFVLEFLGVALLSLTGHLGGFLSGVNGGS